MHEEDPSPASGESVPVNTPTEARTEGRVRLVLRLLLFQVKLIADGLRDLTLVPVSLACGLYGLFFGGDRPSAAFDQLLSLGRDSERFINLFGQHDAETAGTSDQFVAPVADRLVASAVANPIVGKLNELVDEVADEVEGMSKDAPLRIGESPDAGNAAKPTSR
ncbi:MAG: hypothetical protein AAF515_04280 [Pseudomonadota bacterium]